MVISMVKLKWILQLCQKCYYGGLHMTQNVRIPNFGPISRCLHQCCACIWFQTCCHASVSDELKELPTSIGHLMALQKLSLSGCSDSKELLTSVGQLTTLQKLDLQECFKLKTLLKYKILICIRVTKCFIMHVLSVNLYKFTFSNVKCGK